MRKDDEQWQIPDKFKASLDPAEAEAHARLLANDEEQRQRAILVNSPFARATPQDIERSKAEITIQALSVVKDKTPEQWEQFAECWNTVGRPDVAAKVSKLNKKHYNALQKALTRPDADNCKCDDLHLYVKEHGKDKSLIACNNCGFLNVKPMPEHLKRKHRAANNHVGKTKGMSIADAKAYHADKVKQ